MVAAAALMAATTLIAKALGTDALGAPLPAFEVTFGRFLFAAMAIGAVAAWRRPVILWHRWPVHGLRIAFGWSGVTLMFAAAAAIPLAEATAISFLNPILAMLLAIPVLGERPGRWRFGAAAVALAGAAVLLRPGAGAVQPGALLALGAAGLLACEITVIKRLTRIDGPLAILCWSNGMGVIVAALAVIPVWQAPGLSQWAAMALLGVTMACAQGCFVQAMRRADSSFVTPFSYLALVFAGVYDAAVFGVLPDGWGFLGAGLILAGAAILAWREARTARPALPVTTSAGIPSGTSTRPAR